MSPFGAWLQVSDRAPHSFQTAAGPRAGDLTNDAILSTGSRCRPSTTRRDTRSMSDLTVSVVIPTFNRARLLTRAIDSALNECKAGDEIIVVDDGSTDNTKSVVGSFASPVRYVAGEHGGAGRARNLGISMAGGDLIAFLDSDDEWIPGKLSWQRAVMQALPEALFLFSDYGRVARNGERSPNQVATIPRPQSDHHSWVEILGPGIASAAIPGMPATAPSFVVYVGRLYEALIRFWCVSTCTVLVRRREALNALHFAEDVPTFEDLECFARLAQRGPACYMDCDTAWNHGHSGSRLTSVSPVIRADAAVKIIERVWGSDEDYLGLHAEEYQKAISAHRLSKIRYLLAEGRTGEARDELACLERKPWLYRLMCRLPQSVLLALLGLRRFILRQRTVAES